MWLNGCSVEPCHLPSRIHLSHTIVSFYKNCSTLCIYKCYFKGYFLVFHFNLFSWCRNYLMWANHVLYEAVLIQIQCSHSLSVKFTPEMSFSYVTLHTFCSTTVPVKQCVVYLLDPGSRAVCHPPHPCLPVEESSVSAQHPLPPPLPPDCRGAQSPDCQWSWSGSPDPPPWLQVPDTYATQHMSSMFNENEPLSVSQTIIPV